MAGGQERILRRRIRSVQSTKKITRAMELIAASRIVRAQARVEAARPYSEQITHVIANLTGGGSELKSPLLLPREVHRVAYVVIAGDRGLSGAYNTSVIRTAERALQAQVAQGRAYTQFLSAGRQQVVLSTLMPLDRSELGLEADTGDGDADVVHAGYEFEPEPDAILERLLPRYVEARLFAALLEGAASKHAAQQRAMKAATDNADDLITTYTRRMNRARQDAITTEIMEIVGGAEALRGAKHPTEPDRLLAEMLRAERVPTADTE